MPRLNGLHKSPDPARDKTPREINERIDRETQIRLQFYATQEKGAISKRVDELDRECDLEQMLEGTSASVSLFGLVFGTVFGRKWYILPLLSAGFLLQHTMQGWCPPMELFRRLGVRTRKEIEAERYALKALRGDFEEVKGGTDPNPDRTKRAFEAVRS
jgi:hypothetical protein